MAKQQIPSLNTERLQVEQASSYPNNLRNLKHDCTKKDDKDLELGTNWLMMMLNQSGININELLTDIINIIYTKTTKMDTFCFKGQTNTGKTLLANLIASHLILGPVCRRGDQTAFHFDNLPNRTVALMGKPRITMITKNDYVSLEEVDLKSM
nr:non capsid protein NS 1 [Hymenolepis microstoma]